MLGLAQLHQLRGRVGRGTEQSSCVLMVGDGARGQEAQRRLAIMRETSDGFRIAEHDLELRGPGAVFGTQQHGLSDLQFLSEVLRAPALVESARQAAGDYAARFPDAAAALLAALGGRWRRRLTLAQVG
jgi:ATP-dependent DNA helicase RecG